MHLVKYLKEAQIDIRAGEIPKKYNLSIDLATIVVPIMQQSVDGNDFVSRLYAYLLQNQQLLSLLLDACEVRAYLDMFSPRMKIDTQDNRRHKRGGQESNDKDSSKSTDQSRSQSISKKETSSNKHTIELRQVRYFIASTILAAISQFDQAFKQRCTFDVDRIGEGEIKCMSHCVMDHPTVPTIILSNDNDVLLMILLHESSYKDSNEPTSATSACYYRAMIQRQSSKSKNIKRDDVIFHRFELATIEPSWLQNPTSNVRQRCRWVLIVWIIGLCGTDFVSAICAITNHRRRAMLVQCVTNFRHHRAHIERFKYFNFDNFMVIMNLLFAILTDKEDDFYHHYCSQQRTSVIVTEPPLTDFNDYTIHRLDKIARWCARVYWNVLYFIDLPVDFHLHGHQMFESNCQVKVNSYIENESISLWNLINLKTSHWHYLYGRVKAICQTNDHACSTT